MTTNEDRKWEMIGAALSAESSGKSPRLFSSRRTLFGIPSALDEEMAKLEKELAAKRAIEPDALSPAADTSCCVRGPIGNPPARGARVGRRVQHVVHPLEPVFDRESRVLLLGTMPSPKSREVGFYYGHPQTRFWKVLAALFDVPVPESHEEKERLLLDRGVALWDVLAECSIEGTSDGTIAECVPNDIAWLLGKAPIEAVFCTGAKAAELYRRHCEPATHVPCVKLPSTSPANAAASLDALIEAYRRILPYCTA